MAKQKTDLQVFQEWVQELKELVFGSDHNWPFKALEKEMKHGMMKKPKRKRARNKDGHKFWDSKQDMYYQDTKPKNIYVYYLSKKAKKKYLYVDSEN